MYNKKQNLKNVALQLMEANVCFEFEQDTLYLAVELPQITEQNKMTYILTEVELEFSDNCYIWVNNKDYTFEEWQEWYNMYLVIK